MIAETPACPISKWRLDRRRLRFQTEHVKRKQRFAHASSPRRSIPELARGPLGQGSLWAHQGSATVRRRTGKWKGQVSDACPSTSVPPSVKGRVPVDRQRELRLRRRCLLAAQRTSSIILWPAWCGTCERRPVNRTAWNVRQLAADSSPVRRRLHFLRTASKSPTGSGLAWTFRRHWGPAVRKLRLGRSAGSRCPKPESRDTACSILL